MFRVSNIIKVGGSSAVIIPKSVLELTELKKGDAVIVQEKGKIIEIYKLPDIIDNIDKTNKGGQNVIDR